ncbi:MAG: hypothetical protein AB7O96_08935 [Pseudobdellovibrionaceae bacterium]
MRLFLLSFFSIAIRTDIYRNNFDNGHNHAHVGDLNYARAEIGRNTGLDSKNRYAPREIQEQDYISGTGPQSVLVFGDVWHRSPRLQPGEPRLYILIELSP